jgi:hypothetical protein
MMKARFIIWNATKGFPDNWWTNSSWTPKRVLQQFMAAGDGAPTDDGKSMPSDW